MIGEMEKFNNASYKRQMERNRVKTSLSCFPYLPKIRGMISLLFRRLTMKLVICGLLLGFAKAQDQCASAPNPTMRNLCLQIQRWDGRARTSASRKTVALPPGMAGDMAVGAPKNPFAAGASMAADFAPIAANIYQCMTLT